VSKIVRPILWAMETVRALFKAAVSRNLGGTLSALDAIAPDRNCAYTSDRPCCVKDSSIRDYSGGSTHHQTGKNHAHYIADQLEGQGYG